MVEYISFSIFVIIMIAAQISLYKSALSSAFLNRKSSEKCTSTVFIFSSREYDDRITSYVGGDGLEADVVVLPDGTRVSLGTRTSFSYDSRYGKSERIVQLEGEAYFEVAKDKDKPFIVKTKEQSIEALGTKFNVSAYPTDSLLTTTLLEGSVLLTTQNLLHPTVLKPNEQFVYNKRTRSALLQQVDANRFVSWLQNLEEKASSFQLLMSVHDTKNKKTSESTARRSSSNSEVFPYKADFSALSSRAKWSPVRR